MVVDIVIVLLGVTALVRGREIGLVRQTLSALGFFGGLFVGATLIEPRAVGLVHTQLSRLFLTLIATLGTALICTSITEYIGTIIKSRLQTHRLNGVDELLGATAGAVSIVITAWLIAPVIATLPFPSLQQAVRRSFIVSHLQTNLPTPPNVIAGITHLINPNGFPDVFSGLEPKPSKAAPAPDMGALQAAVNADRASVVKIEGRGCGGIVEGSGFVAGQGIVATNAHVVAGVANPVIIDDNGTHPTTTVWFDYNLDLAVLRADNLTGKPLNLDTNHAASGTPGAVLGYPGGGEFSAQTAVITAEFMATGRNIYNQSSTTRDVYEVQANIIPGNSGGPLIEQNGLVAGVVFAQSTAYNQVGYALAMQQVASEINQASQQQHAVSTGSCAE